MARHLTTADSAAMRRAKAKNFAGRLVARLDANKVRVYAVQAVQEAMKTGLEWAVRNPRPFLQQGGVVADGADITMEQQAAVEQELQSLLDRLVSNKLPLWKGNPGKPKGRRNNATIEREAAKAGARRGW